MDDKSGCCGADKLTVYIVGKLPSHLSVGYVVVRENVGCHR